MKLHRSGMGSGVRHEGSQKPRNLNLGLNTIAFRLIALSILPTSGFSIWYLSPPDTSERNSGVHAFICTCTATMVTGVEAAGLVLGSIPLILAGLQFYVEGIHVTKRYWKYKE